MALLMMDGFDYYSDDQEDDFLGKWTSHGTSTTGHNAITGRDGVGQAIRLDGSQNVVRLTFEFPAAIQTVIVGFNFKIELHPTGLTPFLVFTNDETPNTAMDFSIAAGGTIVAKRGATFELDSSDAHLSSKTWYHLEIKYHVDDTVGTLELRINGSVVGGFDFGPGDTNPLGPDQVTGLRIVGSSRVNIFDDFYIMDSTGSRLNDFIGDVKIETIKPDGVGNDAAWTPLAGTNWEAVDETIPDRDTTAVDAVDPGDEDRHTHSNLGAPVPDLVHAVAVNLFAQKLVSGSRNVKAIAFDGTTEGLGADKFPLVDSWGWHQHIFEDHPTGAAVWTAAEVDAGEFGYRLEA